MTGSRTRVALLLFLTFAAGAAAGVAADRLSLVPGTARAEQPAAEAEPDEDRERRQTTIERFADELELTAEQRRRIEAVLEEFRTDLKTMRAEFHPRWHALIDSTRTRIEAVLTPEQVVEYRALLEAQRDDRRRDDDRGKKSGKRDGDRDGADGDRDGADGDRDGAADAEETR